MKTLIITTIVLALALIGVIIALIEKHKDAEAYYEAFESRLDELRERRKKIEELEAKIAALQKCKNTLRKVVVLDGDAELVQKKIDALEADGYTLELHFPSNDLASFVKCVKEDENQHS